jgi:type VI protein secretion system component Hcp
MDVAQLYMLALRPTMTPILGESADSLFVGQIQIDQWQWDFHNLEVVRERARQGKEFDRSRETLEKKRKASLARVDKEDLIRAQHDFATEQRRLQKAYDKAPSEDRAAIWKQLKALKPESLKEETTKALDQLDADIKKALAGDDDRTDQDEKMERLQEAIEDKERNPNFEFTFSKRVDVATTQLLNCMKAGDLLPTVSLTMHQASSNTPWTLVITVTKLRLLDYKLKVDLSDTMTDMREEWKCEFASFGYVYQNRPQAGLKAMTAGGAGQTAAKAATQGTVRTFMMKNMDFF